jgi:hypothetical protein
VSGDSGPALAGAAIRPTPAPAAVAAAAAAVFVVVWVFRWLTLDGRLSGDDHWSLWMAATYLNGTTVLPDFADPGTPLQWMASVAAQWLVGYRVIGEVVLGTSLIAAGISLGFVLAWRAGGSWRLSLLLTALATIMLAATKLYSYPKVFIYPLVLWLSWRYIDRPSVGRAWALAGGVAVAFGYRHDHGAYTAVGASAAVLAAHWRHGVRACLRPLVLVGAATVVCLLPYFALVQAGEGLVPYFLNRTTLRTRFDAKAFTRPWPTSDPTVPMWYRVRPQTPAPVRLAWAPGVSPVEIQRLEQQYALVPAPESSRWQQYNASDTTPENLKALAIDTRVVEIDGVSGTFEPGFALDWKAGGEVLVRFDAALPAGRRLALEQRYRLADRRPATEADAARGGAGAWRYAVLDTSMANVTALCRDGDLEVVSGVRAVGIPVTIRLTRPLPAGPDVVIRWAAGVNDAQRAALERQYGLVAGRIDEDEPTRSMWQYELANRSAANVTALATDGRVARVDQIEPGDTPGTFKARAWSPPPVVIGVTWDAALEASARAELEQRYRLLPPDAPHAYLLLDGRSQNVSALVADRRVGATVGLNRALGRVLDESWLDAQRRAYPWLRIELLPRWITRANVTAWNYWVMVVSPFLVLTVLALDRWRSRPGPVLFDARKMLAAAVLVTMVNLFLLKRLGYVADHFNIGIVMVVWLLARGASGRGLRELVRSPIGAVSVVFVMTLAVSAGVSADLPGAAARNRLTGTLPDLWRFSAQKFDAFATSPPIDAFALADDTGDRAVVRYLHECTRPDDRLLLLTDSYAVPYYAERPIVGHIFWEWGFMSSSPVFQRQTIEVLEQGRVPVVISLSGDQALDALKWYPELRDYVSRHYTRTFSLPQEGNPSSRIWVLTDSRRMPTGRYDRLQLPCFGAAV